MGSATFGKGMVFYETSCGMSHRKRRPQSDCSSLPAASTNMIITRHKMRPESDASHTSCGETNTPQVRIVCNDHLQLLLSRHGWICRSICILFTSRSHLIIDSLVSALNIGGVASSFGPDTNEGVNQAMVVRESSRLQHPSCAAC